MSLPIKRSDWFVGDLKHYAAWYQKEAGWDIAERYLKAVAATLNRLAAMPGIGHQTRFSAEKLQGIRCFKIERPFEKHLLFYRYDDAALYVERVFTALAICLGA